MVIFVESLQKWRQLFDKFDPEGFGEILWEDFLRALDSAEFEESIDCTKRELFRLKAQDRRTNAITFDEFIAVVCFYEFFWVSL